MIYYLPAMASPPEDFPAKLERVKRASVAQLLMRCARLVNERGIARARERFGVPLRASHTALFPHIDLEGTRLTELSRRVGISKQAVGQLVAELEDMGVVERVPDPSDGRAKQIRYTQSGGASLLAGMAALGDVDAELREQIGSRKMQALHKGLLALIDVLEPKP